MIDATTNNFANPRIVFSFDDRKLRLKRNKTMGCGMSTKPRQEALCLEVF